MNIFNLSLKTETFPEKIKFVKVSPIFEKGGFRASLWYCGS